MSPAEGVSCEVRAARAARLSGCAVACVGLLPAVIPQRVSVLMSCPTVQERTAEPWILHDFGRDFYGEELRLVIAAYIRPEANFSSLDALIARIHADADVARTALDQMPLASLALDPFLQPAAT